MQLISRLKENRDSGIYPFHMPGHKRMPAEDELLSEIYGIDITEIRGFDDLHNATSILKESEERARDLFGADETHFLVNGSTGGILAAICGTVTDGDDIVVAANCHRSVFNGIMLSSADIHMITPQNESFFETSGGIEPEAVEASLSKIEKDRAKVPQEKKHRTAVVITSPTYEGIVSDVGSISRICHEKGAVLIVDAAHGAHFGFSERLPQSAVAAGADVVITSVHKTLPSMTMTALIHLSSGCPSKDRIRSFLPVFMTSSPSYVLMASMDSMIKLLEDKGDKLFEEYMDRLDDLYSKTEDLECLSVLQKEKLSAKGSFDHDKGKIVVRDLTEKMSGKELYDLLYDKYGICAEMATASHVVLMTGIADTKDGFDRLNDAFHDIDRSLAKGQVIPKARGIVKKLFDRFIGKKITARMLAGMPDCPVPYGMDEIASFKNRMKEAVFEEEIQYIPIELAEGKTAKEIVTVYPPGIPVTVPGEMITGEAVDRLLDARKNGLMITGLKDEEMAVIWERSST